MQRQNQKSDGYAGLAVNPEVGTKVLVNGVAKSGTHLLRKIVALAGYQVHPFCLAAVHANRAAVLWSAEQEPILGKGIEVGVANPTPMHELLLRQLIRSVTPGWVFNGHCGYDPDLLALLNSEGVRIINILRDPRDIAVSLARYLTSHEHPATAGKSEAQLLLEVIDGIDLQNNPPVSPVERRDLGETCEAFLSWRECKDVLTVRFEDIIGPEGGGDIQLQLELIRQLLTYIGRDPERATEIRGQVFGGTRTFDRGQIGSWRSMFRDEHVARAKQVMGRYLVSAGYEPDLNW